MEKTSVVTSTKQRRDHAYKTCIFFTRVSHACFSRGICVQYGGFPRMKHACNAAMPVASTVVLAGPQGTQPITKSVFRISFLPYCQIHNLNGFFNRPIMVRTHILVLMSGPRTRISALFR